LQSERVLVRVDGHEVATEVAGFYPRHVILVDSPDVVNETQIGGFIQDNKLVQRNAPLDIKASWHAKKRKWVWTAGSGAGQRN
jgi:hypothetical protein